MSRPLDRYMSEEEYRDGETSESAQAMGIDQNTFSTNVQFQIPSFMLSSGAPNLVAGGGAEVLNPASVWYINTLARSSEATSHSNYYGDLSSFLHGMDTPSPPNTSIHSSGNYASTSAPFSFPPANDVPNRFPLNTSLRDHPITLRTPSFLTANVVTTQDMRGGGAFDARGFAPSGTFPAMPGTQHSYNEQQQILSTTMRALAAAAVEHGETPIPPGLPMYSPSGFDLLSVLSRVATRPNPTIHLGPVDLTCSFVVVDVRRHDSPIVYVSPSFTQLTGYSEAECLGKNCRFLQSPAGEVTRGQVRPTSMEAVSRVKKALAKDQECQQTIVNYRKGGAQFLNMLTVIPIGGGVTGYSSTSNGGGNPFGYGDGFGGGTDEVVYHVGFQIDLGEQPSSILRRLRDGTYVVDYSSNSIPPVVNIENSRALVTHAILSPTIMNASSSTGTNSRKYPQTPVTLSKDLRLLLKDASFLESLSFSTSTCILSGIGSSSILQRTSQSSLSDDIGVSSRDKEKPEKMSDKADSANGLHLLLLEASPDFIHVVSLKGSFLYVAPSVRRVLGYEPEELVDKSLAEICHPADIVPLTRELKESSTPQVEPNSINTTSSTTIESGESSSTKDGTFPKPVDLLFRARRKDGRYVWMECRGRLHVEPGKGRKAIILSGRTRDIPHVTWNEVAKGGGLSRPFTSPTPCSDLPENSSQSSAKEFFATISSHGMFLSVGTLVSEVLGWDGNDMVGASIADYVSGGQDARNVLLAHVSALVKERPQQPEWEPSSSTTPARTMDPSKVACDMKTKAGTTASTEVIIYRPLDPIPSTASTSNFCAATPLPIVVQIKLVDPQATSYTPSKSITQPLFASVFDELEATRNSNCWQTQLQLLKLSNQSLQAELRALEQEAKSSPSEHGQRHAKRPLSSYGHSTPTHYHSNPQNNAASSSSSHPITATGLSRMSNSVPQVSASSTWETRPPSLQSHQLQIPQGRRSDAVYHPQHLYQPSMIYQPSHEHASIPRHDPSWCPVVGGGYQERSHGQAQYQIGMKRSWEASGDGAT